MKLTPTRIVEYTTDGTWRPATVFLAVVKNVNENGTIDIRVSRIAVPDKDVTGVSMDRVRLVRKDKT